MAVYFNSNRITPASVDGNKELLPLSTPIASEYRTLSLSFSSPSKESDESWHPTYQFENVYVGSVSGPHLYAGTYMLVCKANSNVGMTAFANVYVDGGSCKATILVETSLRQSGTFEFDVYRLPSNQGGAIAQLVTSVLSAKGLSLSMEENQ